MKIVESKPKLVKRKKHISTKISLKLILDQRFYDKPNKATISPIMLPCHIYARIDFRLRISHLQGYVAPTWHEYSPTGAGEMPLMIGISTSCGARASPSPQIQLMHI